ncbi:hypothetical protein D3C75_1106970 [compost metagenome]
MVIKPDILRDTVLVDVRPFLHAYRLTLPPNEIFAFFMFHKILRQLTAELP